jgi:hypothetical protein
VTTPATPPAAVHEIEIRSWDDFFDLAVSAHMAPGLPFLVGHIFRGQKDARWTLAPSFTRIAVERGWDPWTALEMEEGTVKALQKAAPIHLPPGLMPEDNKEWLDWLTTYSLPRS